METSKKILSALAQKGEAMKAGEIADTIGMDRKDVEKAIKKMVAEGALHSPKRCFYDRK